MDIPDVCTLEDLARVLGKSYRTVKRMRQYGRLPVPEMDAIGTGRRPFPRFSGALVRRYLETGEAISVRRLRRVG
jgi:hypothetical protein